ncbi:MAG: hypothetical protein Q8907_12160 [Bacteroidota bacterium]|nr:hypothetical protein [Bacteroidota bacterium]MDP4226451.1 hypothetical protein [Bacteroidota bacterium]MDP4275024.1 hypothetical protein [Bacteroidota bacterium]
MEQQIIDFKNLTQENVWDLSEEEAFTLIQKLQNDIGKEERSPYLKIIDTAFEFRSISSKRRDIKQSLTLLGFKFFKADDKLNMLTGIFKRKSPHKSFY